MSCRSRSIFAAGQRVKGIEPSTKDSKVVDDQLSRKCAEASNTQMRAQIADAQGRDLSRVVAAWSQLSAPLKAVILAIVDSSANVEEDEL
jgi:hypothetical protein